MRTMFTDAIEFLNNMENTSKALGDVKENDIDPLKLIQAVVSIGEVFRRVREDTHIQDTRSLCIVS